MEFAIARRTKKRWSQFTQTLELKHFHLQAATSTTCNAQTRNSIGHWPSSSGFALLARSANKSLHEIMVWEGNWLTSTPGLSWLNFLQLEGSKTRWMTWAQKGFFRWVKRCTVKSIVQQQMQTDWLHCQGLDRWRLATYESRSRGRNFQNLFIKLCYSKVANQP